MSGTNIRNPRTGTPMEGTAETIIDGFGRTWLRDVEYLADTKLSPAQQSIFMAKLLTFTENEDPPSKVLEPAKGSLLAILNPVPPDRAVVEDLKRFLPEIVDWAKRYPGTDLDYSVEAEEWEKVMNAIFQDTLKKVQDPPASGEPKAAE